MRYALLYLHFLRFSFSKALEFRVDFFFRVAMDLVFYAVNLAFFSILYQHTAILGGWGLDEIYLFVAAFLFVDAAMMTVFANNLWWLPIFVNKGDLDYYLVRPVSPLFFLSLREFAANSFLNLLIAGGLVVWAVARYPVPLEPARIGLYLLFLVVGVLLCYLFRMLFVIPVFWLHSNRGLIEASWSIQHLSERPTQIYAPWLRRVLTTAIPVAFFATVPVRVLLDGPDLGLIALTLGVVAGLCLAVALFWRAGLRAYSSASS